MDEIPFQISLNCDAMLLRIPPMKNPAILLFLSFFVPANLIADEAKRDRHLVLSDTQVRNFLETVCEFENEEELETKIENLKRVTAQFDLLETIGRGFKIDSELSYRTVIHLIKIADEVPREVKRTENSDSYYTANELILQMLKQNEVLDGHTFLNRLVRDDEIPPLFLPIVRVGSSRGFIFDPFYNDRDFSDKLMRKMLVEIEGDFEADKEVETGISIPLFLRQVAAENLRGDMENFEAIRDFSPPAARDFLVALLILRTKGSELNDNPKVEKRLLQIFRNNQSNPCLRFSLAYSLISYGTAEAFPPSVRYQCLQILLEAYEHNSHVQKKEGTEILEAIRGWSPEMRNDINWSKLENRLADVLQVHFETWKKNPSLEMDRLPRSEIFELFYRCDRKETMVEFLKIFPPSETHDIFVRFVRDGLFEPAEALLLRDPKRWASPPGSSALGFDAQLETQIPRFLAGLSSDTPAWLRWCAEMNLVALKAEGKGDLEYFEQIEKMRLRIAGLSNTFDLTVFPDRKTAVDALSVCLPFGKQTRAFQMPIIEIAKDRKISDFFLDRKFGTSFNEQAFFEAALTLKAIDGDFEPLHNATREIAASETEDRFSHDFYRGMFAISFDAIHNKGQVEPSLKQWKITLSSEKSEKQPFEAMVLTYLVALHFEGNQMDSLSEFIDSLPKIVTEDFERAMNSVANKLVFLYKDTSVEKRNRVFQDLQDFEISGYGRIDSENLKKLLPGNL